MMIEKKEIVKVCKHHGALTLNQVKIHKLGIDCKICNVLKSKKWALKNKDKVLGYAKEYRKKWCLKNPEKIRKYAKEFQKKNPSYMTEYKRRWRINNPEKYRERMNIDYRKFKEKKLEEKS